MAQIQWPSFMVIAILFLTCNSTISSALKFDNETDRHALLSFKSMLSDDSRALLASWNDSLHFCKWTGVACSKRHPQRVAALVLVSRHLTGSISPAIANLTFLKKMDLSDNRFRGPIPQEIGHLRRLQHLNLSVNSLDGGIPATLSSCFQLQNISIVKNMLTGEIPPALSNCSHLRQIDFNRNSLTGHIPPPLTNLSSLTSLVLAFNQLTGTIPSTIGDLYSLTELWLDYNNFSGTIPHSIGKLSNLTQLSLEDNQLTGIIPCQLWNLSSLFGLSLSFNNLSGSLPENLGQLLPLIKIFDTFQNHLHGPIPMSLSNASHLEIIQLGFNWFSGTIPPDVGSLQNLKFMSLAENLLEAKEASGWRFLDGLTNCTGLRVLELEHNHLGGILPRSITNLSTKLEGLGLAGNEISGSISPDIKNLVGLTWLFLGKNLLTGPIPASIGMLRNMHILDMDTNMLSGEIPYTIGNLSQLIELFLNSNQLSGTIPMTLGNCQNLITLNLESNQLSGNIPKEILTISTISKGISLAWNSLTGPIPSEVGALRNTVYLNVQRNKLSGEIPSSIGECKELLQLYLSSNLLSGSIPSSLSALRGIQEINLSQNNLSGRIPDFLQDLDFLHYLNLSFNNFEGAVPRNGVFANTSALSVLGNNNLCGGNPEMHLPACPSQSSNKKHNSHQLIFIISIVSSILFLFMLFCLLATYCWRKKSRRKHLDSTTMNESARVSYAELVRATNRFSENNLIGSGSFARVYKGTLPGEDGDRMKVVAVKVLDLQMHGASKSFIAECEALRNIRHRNLVKIHTICSSIDFRGNDFKALVLDFMANGNLDDWLHPKESNRSEQKWLNLAQRLNIAIDVAMALDYLHNYNETPIIHCDLKPSNVLLDGDMTAHVGDFGLAKILKNVASKSSQHSTSTIGLKGTIGYIPPEYGMANRVSTRGDAYSYGILLLEMFTAKSPADGIFVHGLSIRKFVEMTFPQQITDVIDPQLLSIGDGDEEANRSQSTKGTRAIECIASVLQIGIICSNESPPERMEMGEVLKELHSIKECFLKD